MADAAMATAMFRHQIEILTEILTVNDLGSASTPHAFPAMGVSWNHTEA
jgi:hypothetical protein